MHPPRTQPSADRSALRRGDVCWVDLDPPRGSEIQKTRPAVIVSADALNGVRRTVIVVPLSTGPAARPPLVIATSSMGAGSVAVCDQFRAVDRQRLSRRADRLIPGEPRAVEDGSRRVLGLLP